MSFFACIVSSAPLRSEASHRSEIVSQLLFGEFAVLLESSKDFIKVKCLYDDYEGWCQVSQLAEVDEEITQWQPIAYTLSNRAEFSFQNTPVWPGLGVPVYSTDAYLLGKYSIRYCNGIDKPEFVNDVATCARSYLNTPYLWGGRSSWGIDCSGFTQQVMKQFGIHLWRDSSQQALQGEHVGFLQEALPGDLAFFDNEEGKIIHTGILLNQQEIIHASGRVRIDPIDSNGIVNADTGQRTHKLRIIKRMRVS
jgi:gamma-D-glutamyl-L-lysine dipeptidyl-peptidase